MLKSFAVISAVTVAVYAQSSSLIPSDVSAGCRTFLNSLNTNTQVATCTGALNVALEGFAPGKAATSSAAQVTSALEAVCSEASDAACPANVLNQQITSFYSACTPELTSNPVPEVVRLYDILYVVPPMRQSICSKGDDGKWCVMSGTSLEGAKATEMQSSLYTQDGQTVIPNTDSFTKNNVPFLLLTPDLDKEALCKPCTRNVLTAYINHESNVPYAPGLSKSQLLQPQSALFSAVKKECGDSFMDNQIKAAGGIGSNLLPTGAAAPSGNAALSGLLAIAAGVATLAIQAAF